MIQLQLKPQTRVLWALAGITALAAFVRFWQITSLPPGYWYDEAHKSLVALEILRGIRYPIYVTDIDGLEAGYFWLLAAVFRVGGPSYFGTRGLAAFMGTATIPLTFWAARRLYQRHPYVNLIALTSAGVLGFIFWHVHFSRFGIETITVPFFSVAVCAVIAWAWQQQTTGAFVFAGVVLGLSQYTNPGARVLPLEAVLVFAIFGNWTQRKRLLGYGIAFLVGAFVIYAPLGWFFLNNPVWFSRRLVAVSGGVQTNGWQSVATSLVRTLLSINFRGDGTQRHNLSLRPALDVALSLWMWVGIVGMFRSRPYWRSHLSLSASILVNLIPTILSDGSPSFGRALGVVPFLVILPALGMAAVLERLPKSRVVRALITVSLTVSVCMNLYDYFWRYPHQMGMFEAWRIGLWEVTQTAAQEGNSDTGYLVLRTGDMYEPVVRLTQAMAAGDLRVVNAESCLAYPARTMSETVFATWPRWAPDILEQYPIASRYDIWNDDAGSVYASVITVPAGQTSRTLQETAAPVARFGNSFDLSSAELSGVEFSAGDQVLVKLRWLASTAISARYTSFVHLSSDTSPFVTGFDREPCDAWYPTNQWHPGEIIEYELPLSLPSDLPPGTYTVLVGMYDSATGERLPIAQSGQREPDRAMVGVIAVK